MKNIILVANLFGKTGGTLRAKLAIKEYIKRGLNPYIILNSYKKTDFSNLDENLSRKIIGTYTSASSWTLKIVNYLLRYYSRNIIKLQIYSFPKNVNLIFSLHESFEEIYITYLISNFFNIKCGALLQLPPFYGNKKRLQNILRSYLMWYKLLFSSVSEEIAKIILEIYYYKYKNKIKNLLNRFDFLILVSKAISKDMGEDFKTTYTLDPGTALLESEIEKLTKIKNNTKKENIIIFGGRSHPLKGLHEAILVWKDIYKKFNNYKLVITGNLRPKIKFRLLKLIKKLGIKESIIFTGFLPREERLKLVAKARLMLYPSHIDSVSYSVLESLYLGTPVVAYDIPAIKLYYSGLEGIEIIKELDIEAMTQKALEMLEKENIKVETPKFKSWKEIMDEEVNILNKYL